MPKISIQRLSNLETNSDASSPTLEINKTKTTYSNNKLNNHQYLATTIDNLKEDSNINQYSSVLQQFKNNSNEFNQQNFFLKYNNETTNCSQSNKNQIMYGLPKVINSTNIIHNNNNVQLNDNVINNNCIKYQKSQQIWNENSSKNIVFDQVCFY